MEGVKKNDNTDVEAIENIELCDSGKIRSLSPLDEKSSNMDSTEFQKSQLPDTSIDGSPFMNLKSTRLRKKKIQSKLTYLKQISSKKKKNETNYIENDCKNEVECKKVPSLSLEEPSTSENLCSNKQSSVHACPVCWKQFENTGDQMQHMKTCAVKHNLTLKQLLDALDLQTKQIEERKTLGLPCVPTTSVVRKSTSRKSSSLNDKEDPDLQLGLALSVSMSESEEQKHLVEQEIMLEAGLGDEVSANQASLLERFGFTSTRPVLPSIYTRTRAGKMKLKGTPVLLIRTQDERERLITEKVAIILTNEENKQLSPISVAGHKLQSEVLFQLQNVEYPLWKKASVSPCSEDCETYYVETLSYVITPSKMKAGSKLKHLSQVPCRLKTPEKHTIAADESLKLNVEKDSLTNSLHECSGEQKMDTTGTNQDKCWSMTAVAANTKNQGIHNESIYKFADDWKMLLNNSSMSNLKIRVQDGSEIYVHELVFFVRCPNILQDVEQETGTQSIKYITWSEISLKCALAFLEFIYCGSLHKIIELKDSVDEIIFLSTKYCVEELRCFVKNLAGLRTNPDLHPGLELGNISLDVNFGVVKRELHDMQASVSLSSPVDKFQTERLLGKENVVKEEQDMENNSGDSSSQVTIVNSAGTNSSVQEFCTSPDPFIDSSDHEMIVSSCNGKYFSPNTQQNMDNLLEALNDDNEEKVQQHQYEGTDNKIEQSEVCDVIKESPEIEIVHKQKNDTHETSVKRKRPVCSNIPNLKQMCKNDRNPIRKSLLSSFSDEGGNTSGVSQSNHKNNSVSTVESVGGVPGNGSIHDVKGLSCIPVEVTDEDSETQSHTDIHSMSTEKLSQGSTQSTQEFYGVQDRDDALGDFCADYEYQNFYANYSCRNENASVDSKHEEKSVQNSPLVSQKFFAMNTLEDKFGSPLSSPLSVKSLPRADSPCFRENKSTRKKATLPRTHSSSDVSVASSSSPISIRCLSQSSIHLKTSRDTNTGKNKKVQSTSENHVLKLGGSSGVAERSPVTPSPHVQRTPNRSLNSVKRLLEDSFTAELEKNVLENILGDDCEGWPCSTPLSAKSRTSVLNKQLPNIKTGENCVTPMADYSDMDTPMLKRELQKYGLKPLKRKRAKQILKHIYNELHPVVPVQSNVERLEPRRDTQDCVLPLSCPPMKSKEVPVTVKQCKKKSRVKKNVGAACDPTDEAGISSENEVSLPSTQESSSSSQCEFEVPEDVAEDDGLSQIDATELPAAVHNYIMTNPEIHQQVLLYEPIWLEHLQDCLKAQGHKFKLDQLMEYLDEECITFRTSQGNKTRKRKKSKEKNNK